MRFISEEYLPAAAFGKSSAAIVVASKFEEIAVKRNHSQTQATREARLARILNYLLSEEFSVSNWDKCDAEPIKKDAISHVYAILRNIPKHLPLPEVVVEPTGDIGMDWTAPKAELAASVDEKGVLSFACLSSQGEETFGSGKIQNEKFLPKNFLEMLSSIY